MDFKPNNPPREFVVGLQKDITIKDCGQIELCTDEQVTFVTLSGTQYDVVRKSWGYYATPSLNGRLRQFGLRAILVKNKSEKFYLLLVEQGQEQKLHQYLVAEEQEIVCWLDEDDHLSRLLSQVKNNSTLPIALLRLMRCISNPSHFRQVHVYHEPPAGETHFAFGDAGKYEREIWHCQNCGHFVSYHGMGAEGLYSQEYVDSTYRDPDGIQRNFERIIHLSPEKSDNVGRVRRLLRFARDYFADQPNMAAPTILDVGSGLGVFAYQIKQAGWECTALDTDPRLLSHIRESVSVHTILADYQEAENIGSFNVISFNKVLEHVEDPVAMLARSTQFLKTGGFIYVELPDGEAAVNDPDDYGREEFFIEHFHIFSMASVAILAQRAGFEVIQLERLREPSSKYTIRAFLRLSEAAKPST